MLLGEFNRRGQSRRVLLAILLVFALELLDVGLENLADRAFVAVPLLYASLLLPLAVALWLLHREGGRPPARRLAVAAAS